MKKISLIKIIMLIIFLLISILFFEEYFVFSFILIVAAAVQYFTYRGEVKFNIGHVFFLAVLIQGRLGTAQAIILLVFAGFLPKVYCGELDLKGMLSLPIEILLVLLGGLVSLPLMITGIMLAIVNYALHYVIARYSGESFPEIVAEICLPFLMNLLYFLSASGPVGYLIGLVIGA
jgi:hypothetical protein